jgi:hypothetical protein
VNVVIAILSAYAVTGVFCVWRDLRDPLKAVGAILNYQAGGSVLWLLFATITWLPATLIAIYWKPGFTYMGREITALGVFVLAFIVVGVISN